MIGRDNNSGQPLGHDVVRSRSCSMAHARRRRSLPTCYGPSLAVTLRRFATELVIARGAIPSLVDMALQCGNPSSASYVTDSRCAGIRLRGLFLPFIIWAFLALIAERSTGEPDLCCSLSDLYLCQRLRLRPPVFPSTLVTNA